MKRASSFRRAPSPLHWLIALLVALAACAGVAGGLSIAIAQQGTPTAQPAPAGSYAYSVQVGDSWTSIARRTGVSIEALQEANPQAVRSNGLLRVGEELVIPAAAPAAGQTPAARATTSAGSDGTPAAGAEVYHVVKPGESWNSIAKLYGVPARLLRAANPRAVRADLVLYRGERLLIPPVADASAAPPATSEAAAPAATPEASPTPVEFADRATEAPTEEPTEEPTATPTETATPEPTLTPTPTPQTEIGINCPASIYEYPAQINAILNNPEWGIEGVRSYFADCGSAPVDDGILVQDLTGDGVDELLVLYADPGAPENSPAGDMIIYTIDGDSFIESFRARAAGKVSLVEISDINEDSQPDILYVDTTCGASTCFDNVNVRSWTGSEWANWTAEPVTMAYADYSLDESSDEGQGLEIVLEGGTYGSAGAGPQRARTETWASIGGAPYTLLDRTYEASDCIYFAVLDANAEFLKLPNADLDVLEQLYTKAATDPGLTTCWNRPDEEAELRSFSLFRLALVAAYQGVPEISGDLIASISEIYTTTIYAETGRVWLESYAKTQSIPQACQAVNAFATANPLAWQALADYGYANPGFTANDVCPVLDVDAAVEPEPAVAADAPTPEPMAETVAEPATAEPAAAASAAEVAAAPEGEAEMPACPDTLADYTASFPLVFAAAADHTAVAKWMRDCRALDDKRGAVAWGDFNGDGTEDVIVLPVIVSDLGFGPNGTQGAVLVYHGGDKGYTLAASPEIYGQSNLLAVEDLDDDGTTELAWSVVGCSTFCVTEVQALEWDEDEGDYVSAIEPGATLAEGTALFEPLPAASAALSGGAGKRLVLTGGVSDTPEGGLAVPHTEEWQSIDGGPFQRISWTYDRKTQGNDCLGLRLIEADVALQASPVIGYADAIAAYEAAFDPKLKACSIFGIDGVEELVYLQGLASFRLMEAQALSGDAAGAQASLLALTQGQPESAYSRAAREWMDQFEADGDVQAACDAVLPIFEENVQTWQMTDHFGYNHPALAAEQICYVPPATA